MSISAVGHCMVHILETQLAYLPVSAGYRGEERWDESRVLTRDHPLCRDPLRGMGGSYRKTIGNIRRTHRHDEDTAGSVVDMLLLSMAHVGRVRTFVPSKCVGV